MNSLENLYCSSGLWRYLTKRHLLPWLLSGSNLGDHLLEIGAGFGAATAPLSQRVRSVTSLEYDHQSALKLKSKVISASTQIVQADAARLPFADGSFSSAVAILVLHHLKSTELQDQAFAEAFRVLRPGGVFLGFEISDSWFNRTMHFRSTFTPLLPGSTFARLTAAGFSRISVDFRNGAFRFTALRAKPSPVSSQLLPNT